MIILEGPDNSGKTTLGKHLADAMKLQLIHGGGPPVDLNEALARVKLVMSYPKPAIYDRVIQIGEGIYGPICNRKALFNTRTALSKLQSRHTPLIIYCRPPTNRIITLEEKDFRPGEEVDHIKSIKENQGKIIKAYDELFAEVPHIKYNYMTHTLADLYNLTMICINYKKGKHPHG
jgi:hypothetical protein